MTTTNTSAVRVPNIDWDDLITPDRMRGCGEMEAVILTLAPDRRVVEIATRPGRGGTGYGTPMQEHHRRILAATVTSDDGCVDGPAVAQWLASAEGQRLLAAVCDGHSEAWDGSNTVGQLTEAAGEAWQEIERWLAHAPGFAGGLWDAGDYLASVTADELGITAGTTDAELAAIEERLDAEAAADRVILDGTANVLRDMRAALIDG